jgi:two-component system, LuxR family, response regulator FixJ
MPAEEALVHVIDDDPAARDSLSFLLSSADIGVATYDSAKSFLRLMPTLSVGCLVTDVRMPEISGIDLLRDLRNRGLEFPVIVITGHGDVPLAVSAMRLGATDFLEKPFDDAVVLAAVQSALARKHEVEKGAEKKAEVQQRLATLSERERQVLDGLVVGNPNKTIAYDLGISPRTVEIYRANLMTKMNAATLSDLVRMAIIAGAFDVEGHSR